VKYADIDSIAMTEPMKAKLRKFVQRVAPEFFHRYYSYFLHRYYRQRFGHFQRAARRLLYAGTLPRILSGPFSGMPYLDETVWGPIVPKWLGCYELELHNIVEGACASGYNRVINIGCAEGYYAVGFGWRMAQTEIFAFDTDPIARDQTRRLAAMVGASTRITIGTRCGRADLNRLISDRSMVVVDVEGEEFNLLDTNDVPCLKNADILVEIHEGDGVSWANSVAQSLGERFAGTHRLTWRRSVDRKSSVEQFAALWKGKISEEEFCAMLDEGRPVPQTWLWATTKSHEPRHSRDLHTLSSWESDSA
jgi:hypothetical protein